VTAAADMPWRVLFGAEAQKPGSSLEFNLLRKRGEPLLLIPTQRRLAVAALTLYPAQSRKAKLARAIMGFCLRNGLEIGVQHVSLPVDPQSAFCRFLATFGAARADLSFAMLLGNPRVPGRRCVIQLFDAAGDPARIVKAGVGEAAIRLIQHEAGCLQAVAGRIAAAPKFLGSFAEGEVAALAMQFAPGRPPRGDDLKQLTALLQGWLDGNKTVSFSELSVAHRLRANPQRDDVSRPLLAGLDKARFHPAVFHGDLAPWNVRVNPANGKWLVLDWERGELIGPPAWDWFHFVVQPLILVRRLSAPALAVEVERHLRHPEFVQYAAAAKIESWVRPLFLAYLAYCRDVLKPTEGIATTEALLALLAKNWSGLAAAAGSD